MGTESRRSLPEKFSYAQYQRDGALRSYISDMQSSLPSAMKFSSAIESTLSIWDSYYTRVYGDDLMGQLSTGGRAILYPNILLCTETPTHHILELIGATRSYEGLTVRKHKDQSTVRYLSQFSSDTPKPALWLGGRRHQTSRMTITQGVSIDAITSRFPFAALFKSVLFREGGTGATIDFGPDFESAVFDNCLLVNSQAFAIRVKHVLFMAVVSRTISEVEYTDFIAADVLANREVRGVHTVPKGEAEDVALAGQFAALYLLPGLRETTVGEFLCKHPTIIERALQTRRFIYEPFLAWQAGTPAKGDAAINPDLLVRRDDGYFDIYDLKTAALDRENITKGKRRRRRFIDYVEEGVAQLAHYREWFAHAENASHAQAKYGVKVKDPALVLVVGNFDNARPDEIEEAARRLRGITILDYDTFLQLFLNHHGR